MPHSNRARPDADHRTEHRSAATHPRPSLPAYKHPHVAEEPTAAEHEVATASGAQPIYLSLPQVVQRYAGIWSRWTIYEHVRAGLLPHLKLPGRRELLFRLEDLERYEGGEVDLDMVKLPGGGRSCRPRQR